jgi:hypothetical protein
MTRKPRSGTLSGFREYWERMDAARGADNRLPDFAFDFISIHDHSDGTFGFCSPLCLTDATTGQRPSFENERYKTKQGAIKAGRELAKFNGVWLVDCCTDEQRKEGRA